jgi:hypothetical protein
MAGNSRADILAKMQQGSITEGWGAITVFNRTRLNRILLQQWIEQYDGTGYMPPFSGRAFINADKTEYADLSDIVLASPRLSFESANFNDSIATLTLSILSGSYTAYTKAPGRETLLYSYQLSEAHGYTLTVDVDLTVVTGEVDELGRVVLDLSRGTKIECNLAGPKVAREALGKYFQQRFDELPPQRRVFELGILDLNGYNPLTPKRFELRTQAAPGGNDVNSSTYRDGAVVVFVQLKASEFGGGMPPSHFPYLIPDDQDAQGDKYSATLVLAKDFVGYADGDKLALIHSLLFPGDDNVFVELDRATPHDMAVFGNIDPSRTAISIDPPLLSLQAGSGQFRYRALRDGQPLSGVTWSVRSLNTHGSAGEMEQSTGLYRPVGVDRAARETVRNVVTATYTEPSTGQTYRVSALLLVTSEPMAISPSVAPCLLLGEQQPITFVASAVSGADLVWSQPQYGSLVATGNTAIYTPPSTPVPDDVAVQNIEASNPVTGETVSAAVVLLKYLPDFAVTPGFTGSLSRSGTLQLQENMDRPLLKRRWTVLGEGTVSDSGLYSAPARFSRPVAVVVCDLLNDANEIQYYGYGVVQLSNAINSPTWKGLSRFNISKVVGQAYANGMQQMLVNIVVQTAEVDNETYELTSDEEASLRLVNKFTRAEIPFIVKGQEGIEFGSRLSWATNWDKNRFHMTENPSAMATQGGAVRDDALLTNKHLYVHTRGRSPTDTPDRTQFVATFNGSNDQGQFYSDLHPGPNETEDQGHVTLTPVRLPTKTARDYEFKGTRVAGGGAGGEGRPTGPGWDPLPPGEDDFDFFLKTTDYWRLGYVREGLKPLLFTRCRFEDIQSLVRWESEYENETMFSYTGYAFHVFAPGDEIDPNNRLIEFDHALTARTLPPVLKPVFENDQAPVSGELLITLTRADDVRRSTGTDLEILNGVSMVAELLDIEGNRHRLDVRFVTDSRNKLELNVLT